MTAANQLYRVDIETYEENSPAKLFQESMSFVFTLETLIA